MIPQTNSFSKPIKAILVIIALGLIQMTVPSTEVYSFSISSDEVNLKKPLAVYKSLKTIMASVKTDYQHYQQTAEVLLKQTEEAVKTWKIVKKKTKKEVVLAKLWPLKGAITSKFGMRIHPVTGNRSFHNGIDIRGKSGTSVMCPVDGVVIETGWAGALGRMVKLKTQSGHTLCFGHLSKIKCKEGQKIKRGQIVGNVGATGRATGPHLHFTVLYRGDYINPIKYLSK